MTLQHFIRTMMVAGAAMLGLMLAQQARAETGGGSSSLVAEPVAIASGKAVLPTVREVASEEGQAQPASGPE